MKDAGQIAGLVDVLRVNEPTAVALAYGLHADSSAITIYSLEEGHLISLS